MGRKVNLGFLGVIISFVLLALIFYYPIFFGKVPLNGSLLVSFWSPWKYESWPGFPTGVPFKFVGVDELREFFTLFDFTYESVRQGFIPLWSPYIFSGTPHLANWATSVFYPLHLSFLIFSKIQAFIFLKVIAIILSELFIYLYLRTLNLNRRAAFFGGISFSFSSTMLVWGAEIWQAVHSFLWLPLTLFSIEKFIKTKKITYLVLCSLALAFSVMGGYVQTTIYLYIFSFTYALFRMWGHIRSLIFIICAFLASIGLSAIQTVPSFEFFFLSPRREIALTDINIGFLLPLQHIITFFVPDFFGHIATNNWFSRMPGQYYEQMVYVGVVPLGFVLFPVLLKKFKSYFFFFTVWAIVALTMVFDLPTSRLVYYSHIPFLSTAIPIRIIFIASFCVAVLSAFGVAFWLENQVKNRRVLLTLAPLFIIYGMIGVFIISSFLQKSQISNFPANWYVISLHNFALPSLVLILTSFFILMGAFKKSLKNSFYYLIVFILLAHSFIFVQKYLAFSPYQFIYPSHPVTTFLKENLSYSRFWGYGEAAITTNLLAPYQIYSVEGYDPINIKQYNELLSSVNTGTLRGVASRSDALIPNANIVPTEDNYMPRLKLLDLLGVKYVAYHANNIEKNNIEKNNIENEHFRLVWRKDNWSIFENKKVFDRAFLVPDAIYRESSRETIKTFFDPEVDLSKKVITSDELNFAKSNLEASGIAQIKEYKPNRVKINVVTNVPQFLVLTDSFYPGWQATVDNFSTTIYRANHALRTVIVPEGEHEVIFSFKPSSFVIGIIISITTLGILLFALLISRKK